jgi:hypothetical protein
VSRRSIPDASQDFPLDRLIGAAVVDRDGQPAGRIEEFRVDRSSGEWRITEYVLGMAGLLERLNVGFKLVLGGRRRGRVARVDQVDLSNPDHPRLTCRRDELADT